MVQLEGLTVRECGPTRRAYSEGWVENVIQVDW